MLIKFEFLYIYFFLSTEVSVVRRYDSGSGGGGDDVLLLIMDVLW